MTAPSREPPDKTDVSIEKKHHALFGTSPQGGCRTVFFYLYIKLSKKWT